MSVRMMMQGRQPAAGGGSLPVTTNLRVHLAADSLALSNGAAVTSWTDGSGNGHSPTQATGANQPVFVTSVVNGKPVVRFDGTNDQLDFASHPMSGATAGSVFVVSKVDVDPPTDAARTSSPLGRWGTSGDHDHWPFSDGNIYDGWGLNARHTVGNPPGSMAAFRIFHIRAAAADYRFYIDGGAAFYSSTGLWFSVAWNGTAPWLGRNGGFYFDGDIAEVVVYSAALGLTDVNSVGSYLATKYGLTWSTAT